MSRELQLQYVTFYHYLPGMKLRIKNNVLRYRLSIVEVDLLVRGERVSMATSIGNQSFRTSLYSTEQNPSATYEDGGIDIGFLKRRFIDLKESEEEGFSYNFSNADGSTLTVNIEKDYKCIGRASSMNIGLFPHPNKENNVC